MGVFEDMGDWGYCLPCDRLILLEENGSIMGHTSALSSAECRGTGEQPWPEPKELTAEQEAEETGIGRQHTTGA